MVHIIAFDIENIPSGHPQNYNKPDLDKPPRKMNELRRERDAKIAEVQSYTIKKVAYYYLYSIVSLGIDDR